MMQFVWPYCSQLSSEGECKPSAPPNPYTLLTSGVVEGYVQYAPHIRIDTGADISVVHPRLVTQGKCETQYVTLNTITNADIPAQLAAVTVERKGQIVEMTAAVVKDLKYDTLLGMDFPGIGRVAAEVENQRLVGARAQLKKSPNHDKLAMVPERAHCGERVNPSDFPNPDEPTTVPKRVHCGEGANPSPLDQITAITERKHCCEEETETQSKCAERTPCLTIFT